MSFLNLLKNHISRYGAIEIEDLYGLPFTNVQSDGLDGVFTDEEIIDELIGIIASFQLRTGMLKDSKDDAIQ